MAPVRPSPRTKWTSLVPADPHASPAETTGGSTSSRTSLRTRPGSCPRSCCTSAPPARAASPAPILRLALWSQPFNPPAQGQKKHSRETRRVNSSGGGGVFRWTSRPYQPRGSRPRPARCGAAQACAVAAHRAGRGARHGSDLRLRARADVHFPPPPPCRTNWTRLVPPPVLTGQVSSGASSSRRQRAGSARGRPRPRRARPSCRTCRSACAPRERTSSPAASSAWDIRCV